MIKTIKDCLEDVANFYSNREFTLDGEDYKGIDTALAEISQLLEECQPTHAPARIWEEDTASAYELGAEQYWDNIEKRLG